MTVKGIFDFLNSRFPVDTACGFDNVGLLVGNPEAKVKRALVSLDCDLKTADYAAQQGCELIVTHHPVIFEGLKNVLSDSVVYTLIQKNISAISMHTNLDAGAGGVNDCLCAALGIKNTVPVAAADGFLLRRGEISPVTAEEFAGQIKSALGGTVKFVGCGHKIKNVLVCSGSGGGYLGEAVLNSCDALVTADVKHNQFIEAGNLGIALFDAGHFETERTVVEPLKRLLMQQFADIRWLSAELSQIRTVN